MALFRSDENHMSCFYSGPQTGSHGATVDILSFVRRCVKVSCMKVCDTVAVSGSDIESPNSKHLGHEGWHMGVGLPFSLASETASRDESLFGGFTQGVEQ